MPRSDSSLAAHDAPAPRFAMGWAAGIFALATLMLAYPVFTGQFLVNPHSDQYIAGFAFRDFAAQSLRAGQGIPGWNPYLFGGMPYVAAMHGDIFYPTALLRMVMSTDLAMSWGFILHTFLAGLFSYGFLRAWGLGFTASVVGGLAYMLGGPIASYASPGHDGKLFVSALLPLALWFITRGVRDGRATAWGGLALTIGLAVLSPHPQLLQYLLLTSGAFALFLAFAGDARGARLDRRTAVRRLAFALGAVVLGMAIGAIQYLPVREYVSWSPRAGGRDYAYATSYSFPLVELFNLYLPQYTGMLDNYWGPNGIHLHSEYLGASVLVLASLAFGGDADRRFRRFWIGTGFVALLWMLGGSTPFFRIVYELVPGTKFFRAPSTIIYVFALAVAVMASLGTEKLMRGAVHRKLLYAWAGIGAALALLALGGVLSSLAEGSARAVGEQMALAQGYPADVLPQAAAQWGERAAGNAGALVAGAWRSFLFLALAVGVALAAARGLATRTQLTIALVLVVGLDLWSVARHYWLFSAPAASLYASDPAIEYLKAQPQPGRVLVKALGDSGLAQSDPYFGGDSNGRGTGLMVHGIRSVAGYHGNELGRYDQLVSLPLQGNGQVALLPTFWRHENVRYLYTNAAVTDTGLVKLVGPVRNSAGSTVYLYRLPGENPYAWVATASAKAADQDALRAVLDPRFDATRLAVFDTGAASPAGAADAGSVAGSTITASASDVGPGRATLQLSAPASAGAVLMVSENFFPGWSATVDGRAQPVYRADFNLIGVPLPAGARTIRLEFRDAAIATGKTVTILALLLAFGLVGAGVFADRRSAVV